MYRLFESLLGQNMVNALPEDVRKEYLRMADDLASLSYEKVGAIFDKNVENYQQVMKDTMKQFAEIYLQNREFKPGTLSHQTAIGVASARRSTEKSEEKRLPSRHFNRCALRRAAHNDRSMKCRKTKLSVHIVIAR